MSFSSEIKENLCKTSNYASNSLKAEFIGYYLSGNMFQKGDILEFVTENEFGIEHFYKILFILGIDYEPEIRGKSYVAQIKVNEICNIVENYDDIEGGLKKNIAKGAFLGAGSINNPRKNYHLEIILKNQDVSNFFVKLCDEYDINFKQMKVCDKYQVYLKDAEEISRFLALIGANKAVLEFEDVRIMKEMKNKVNRKVNCETANLNKTVDAALNQIDDINLLKKAKKFEGLPSDLHEIAVLRLENPDLSLLQLGALLSPNLSKSAVNRKMKKIHDLAEELR